MGALRAGLAFLAILLFHAYGGPVAPDLRNAIFGIALLLLLPQAVRYAFSQQRWFIFLGLLVLAIVGLLAQHPLHKTFALVGLFSFSRHSRDHAFAFTTASIAILDYLLDYTSGLNASFTSLSTLVSTWTLTLDSDSPPVAVAPEAAGLTLIGWHLTFVLCLLFLKRLRVFQAILLGIGFLVVLAPLAPIAAATFEHLGAHAGHGHGSGYALRLPWIAVVSSIMVSVGYQMIRIPHLESLSSQHRKLDVALVVLFVASVSHTAFSSWVPAASDKRVAFFNKGGFDWDTPTYEELGPYSSGMFGLLPYYLRADGWEATVLEEQEILHISNADCRVLVLINTHHTWTPQQRMALDRFLRKGGSVLILGDHTNVFGLMDGLNPLLQHYGIAYRFDSAVQMGNRWEDEVRHTHTPFLAMPQASMHSYGTGASLDVRFPAITVTRSLYAHSDIGVKTNFVGAFLGDYDWQPSEPLGGIPLVAYRQVGKGQLLTLGDTSLFQNGSIATRYLDTIAPLFCQLGEPKSSSPFLSHVLVFVLLLFPLAGFLRRWDVRLRVLQSSFAATLALPGLIAFLTWAGSTTMKFNTAVPLIVIDEGNAANTGHYIANWNSTSILEKSAARSGLLAIRTKQPARDLYLGAQAVFIIGPQAPLSTGKARNLRTYIRNGGTLVVAAGPEEGDNLSALLKPLAISISETHLGVIPPQRQQIPSAPRFVSPSAIVHSPDSDAVQLYQYGPHTIASAFRIGSGHLVLIADTRYFSQHNTEGEWGWWGGNIHFIHDLFTRFIRETSGAFPTPFPPPDTP